MERPSFWNVPNEYKSISTKKLYLNENIIPGSPAQLAGLCCEDIVNQIDHQTTGHLSHQRATELIKNCPYTVQLNIERTSNLPLTPSNSPQLNLNQTMNSSQINCISPTGSSYSSGGSLYRPSHLCNANTTGIIPSFDHVAKDYECSLAQEKRNFYEERARERTSVITQPHRTLPMITLKPKSVHDYPVGSYLKYIKDPNWHQIPTKNINSQPDKLRQVANQFGVNSNDKMINLQYNSPINIYSNENVARALDLNAKKNESELNIENSPTYKLLREEDELRKQNRASPAFNLNEIPVQSNSFNNLRTSLLNTPGC